MKDFRKMSQKELENYIRTHIPIDFMFALAGAEFEYRRELNELRSDIDWGRS